MYIYIYIFWQVVYNVPHRFDFMKMHSSLFAKHIAQFNVKWDGPITHIILFDTLAQKWIPDSLYGAQVYEKVTLLSHVEIDNEMIRIGDLK